MAEGWSLLKLLESHSSDFFHHLLAKELSIVSMTVFETVSYTLIVKHFAYKKLSQITQKANHIASVSAALIEKSPSDPKLAILLQASRSMWL